jgi:glycosyltransferase involved in cell wall biosynthesis
LSGASTAPLRILLLAPQPFFEARGTPLAVRALVHALRAQMHAVELWTYPRGADVALDGATQRRSLDLPVGRVPPGFSWAKVWLDGPFSLAAWWRMRFGRFDCVHAVEEAAYLVAPWARMLAMPLVVDMDSAIPEQLASARIPMARRLAAFAARCERFTLGQATAVFSICDELSARARTLAPQTAVFQIEDPPLVAAADLPQGAPVDTLRQALDLPERPVILYSGNFEPYQGVELLLDAARFLPGVSFVFMGGEAREIDALRIRAAHLHVKERVVFTGKRPPEDLPLFLALASVLVSPRLGGTNTPFKVYTYLASGKPLVATRVASHTQLLDESRAWLCEPTAADLARVIHQALNEPRQAAERAARGRALIESRYGLDAFQAKVATAYAYIAQAIAVRRGARTP